MVWTGVCVVVCVCVVACVSLIYDFKSLWTLDWTSVRVCVVVCILFSGFSQHMIDF